MGTLDVTRRGPILEIGLANPGKANALDGAMLALLDEQIARVQADAGIRVVVLRGTPGGTFSAGADIREWGPMSPEQFGRDWIARGNAIFRRFEQLRCPTIATIEGLCFGGGFELALCADLRIGSDAARLRFPELGIGAIPGWEGGTRLARIAGRGRALEAVLSGREIDAATAHHWGVLNTVLPAAGFEAGLGELADRLAAMSPLAATLAKQAIVGEHESESFHAQAGREIKASADSAIGISAFFDKRPARF
ncbi:MAG: enoyl-CoA hydratase/isomerase family protein [Burkholderiales bacterium]|nr:enoyl-CoA hydratase/isomerase family protein [Burkholderiales bacterium]MDE2455463.1 enoyl-CoA hydratase/isomerase family protein [Burkholderiales bacterium]